MGIIQTVVLPSPYHLPPLLGMLRRRKGVHEHELLNAKHATRFHFTPLLPARLLVLPNAARPHKALQKQSRLLLSYQPAKHDKQE